SCRSLAVRERQVLAMGSTGERNTLSFHKKMECVQWLIEHISSTRPPRRPSNPIRPTIKTVTYLCFIIPATIDCGDFVGINRKSFPLAKFRL
ncbi:MAG TPA: hypothetical protein VM011_06190, partial [Gammaproteobacteria bacterium]|nr:hypothetical protein [Gammaproteobacteria bacterium]